MPDPYGPGSAPLRAKGEMHRRARIEGKTRETPCFSVHSGGREADPVNRMTLSPTAPLTGTNRLDHTVQVVRVKRLGPHQARSAAPL